MALNFNELKTMLVLGNYAESDKFLPHVSNGRNKTHSPESNIITENRLTAAAKWQLLTN